MTQYEFEYEYPTANAQYSESVNIGTQQSPVSVTIQNWNNGFVCQTWKHPSETDRFLTVEKFIRLHPSAYLNHT